VADRITKRMGIKRPAGAGAGNRRASNSAPAAADSGSGDSDGSGSPGSPNAQQLRRKEIADVIRRNGEDLAETVEQVVEKVRVGAGKKDRARVEQIGVEQGAREGRLGKHVAAAGDSLAAWLLLVASDRHPLRTPPVTLSHCVPPPPPAPPPPRPPITDHARRLR
jgi:hypothetical protein